MGVDVEKTISSLGRFTQIKEDFSAEGGELVGGWKKKPEGGGGRGQNTFFLGFSGI